MKNFFAMFDQYLENLRLDFEAQEPEVQRVVFKNLMKVVVVGVAIVMSTFLYQFVPLLIRVFAFPAFIVGAYFAASMIEPDIFKKITCLTDRSVSDFVPVDKLKLNPLFKNAPSMAFMSGLLIVSCSLAGFVWYMVAGR